MNKNITIIIILAVLILGGGFAWYWLNNVNPVTNYNNSVTEKTANQNVAQNQAKGTMYFSITDATADMKTISSVNMTVDKVQMYSKADGWITVSNTPQTFNLLELKAKNQAVLLGKIEVPADTYSEFKLHVAKVMVTASGKEKDAILPAGDFNIKTEVTVNANTNSAVQFDVLADKSLHQTSKEEFIFTPVVIFDSRVNATVQVETNNVVSVSFGKTNASVHAGMDVDGQIKTNFMVDGNAKLDVVGGTIMVGGGIEVILP